MAAQCIGGPFAEELLVVAGELARVPETPLSGEILYIKEGALWRAKRAAYPIQAQNSQIRAWTDAAYFLKCILQRSAAEMECPTQVRNRQRFILMRESEISHSSYEPMTIDVCKGRLRRGQP